jgi:diaminopimelate epimerase
VVEQGLTAKTELVFEMAKGTIRTSLGANSMVTVDMGPPILEPARIPFQADQQAVTYPLQVAGKDYEISAVSMGNPHAVLLVADIESAPVAELGPVIETHVRFPERVNAGFMQVVNANAINLRVFERGAGETLTCGTGACAAVVAGHLRGLLAEEVAVNTHGGTLRIRWKGGAHSVWMSGPTATVFEGQLAL